MLIEAALLHTRFRTGLKAQAKLSGIWRCHHCHYTQLVLLNLKTNTDRSVTLPDYDIFSHYIVRLLPPHVHLPLIPSEKRPECPSFRPPNPRSGFCLDDLN